MSPYPPLCPPPEGDQPPRGAADADMASEVDEKGIPASVSDLVTETDEALAWEAEVDEVVASETESNEASVREAGRGPRDVEHLIPKARQEELFLDQFDQVRMETFLAYPDPRSDFSAITHEAFTRAFLELSAEASAGEVYEKLMDVATQLAHDDRRYFAGRHGFHSVHIPSLVDLFGFQAGQEFHDWLTVIDGVETQARTVYHLRDVYGMTNQEASEVLGISAGWASKLYTRAQIHLTSAGVSVEELKKCFFDVEIKRR